MPKTFPYSLAIAILYGVMAIAAISQPNPTILWMQKAYGIHTDTFVIVLSLSAGVLMSRPNSAWFILCMIPLAFYMFMSVSLAAGINSPNVSVSVMYAVVIVAFPLAYKLCCIGGVYLHHILGVLVIGLSMALLSSPSVVTLQFIQTQYGIAGFTAVLTLLLSAIGLLVSPTQYSFMTLIGLMMLYAFITATAVALRGNLLGASINMILFVTMFYMIVKRRDYLAKST